MSPGLAFLNKKGFHTKRLDNVEKVHAPFFSALSAPFVLRDGDLVIM